MINPNDLEEPNIPVQIENKIKKIVVYEISFPEFLANRIDMCVKRFDTSYETVFNKLLVSHFKMFLSEIEAKDLELLCFYYLELDKIFCNDKPEDNEELNNSEMKIKIISVKISQEISVELEKICEEIHYNPNEFIKEAIQCQWDLIGAGLEGGYYGIIEEFCNIPRIKQALEKLLKLSKSNSSNQAKNNGVNKIGDQSKLFA